MTQGVQESSGERRRTRWQGLRLGGAARRSPRRQAPQEGGSTAAEDELSALRQAHRALARQIRDAERIADAVRAVLRRQDGPQAITQAAQGITDAAVAALFQPDGHGDPVCTGSLPDSVQGLHVPVDGSSLVARCYEAGHPAWVEDWHADPRLDTERAAAAQAVAGVQLRTGVGYPITHDGRCLAVLVLGCPAAMPQLRQRAAMVDLLATETALALSHEALLLELERLSGSDPLTGAANRRAWELALSRELPRAVREGHPICLLVIDLDHFKQYNDVHGHTAGDRVLRAAVEAWQARLRPGDLLCRWGGEEFAVLLPNCTVWGGRVVAEALRALMPPEVTCSVGVAEWDHSETDHELIARADSYLYAAKAAGRDCVSTAGSP